MRLIDADKLIIEIVHKYGIEYGEVILEIDNAPTIEAEPVKHGRWINGKCSECGYDRVITKVYYSDEVVWTALYKDNYCPTCGANMIGQLQMEDTE